MLPRAYLSHISFGALVLWSVALLGACDRATGKEGMDDPMVDDGGESDSVQASEGDEGDGTGGGGGDTEVGSLDQSCHENLERGPGMIGDPCRVNNDCESFVCTVYATFSNRDGTCDHPLPDCRSRIMGTVVDIRTGEPLSGMALAVVGAAESAGGVSTAPHIIETTSDANGRFDANSDETVTAFVAALGLAEGDGYIPTLFGASGPFDQEGNYEPLFWFRDWYAVAEADLEAWNESLASDPEVAPFLPLDDSGDSMGIARWWGWPSDRLAGVSLKSSPESEAIIRYVNEDGVSFNDQATSSNGLFFVFNRGPGEQFELKMDGHPPHPEDWVRLAGFPDAIFVGVAWLHGEDEPDSPVALEPVDPDRAAAMGLDDQSRQ